MARTTLSVESISRDGLDPTYTAAIADGHAFAHGGDVFIHVKNDDASSKTITIPTPQTVNSLAVADLTVDVPAAGERMIGPFPKATFAQTDDNDLVYIDYSATTSVTVGVFEL